MSRAARKRVADRRVQPYAWLGAGAVTLGLGAAMVGGTAVAFADTGADSSPSASGSGSASAASEASPARKEAPRARSVHSPRAIAAAAMMNRPDSGFDPSVLAQVMIVDTLVTGGVLSSADKTSLLGLAVRPCSRAEELGLNELGLGHVASARDLIQAGG